MVYEGALLRIDSLLVYYMVYFNENVVSNMTSQGQQSSLIYYQHLGQITFERNVFYDIGCYFDEKGTLPVIAPPKEKHFNIFHEPYERNQYTGVIHLANRMPKVWMLNRFAHNQFRKVYAKDTGIYQLSMKTFQDIRFQFESNIY